MRAMTRTSVSLIVSWHASRLLESHGAVERELDLVRLVDQEREVLSQHEPGRSLAALFSLRTRKAVHEVLAADDRQLHADVLLRIAHERLRLAAVRDDVG